MATTPLAKMIYRFGEGKADGSIKLKKLLGGKGAGLAEMTNLGIPVPPGFTITTEVCRFYFQNKKYPAGLEKEIDEALAWLEKVTGKKFGDKENPLLVSVRSGAAVSMPGMMDTILNLGLTEETLEGLAKKSNNPRFAWDAYRRLIQMFGNVVDGIEHEKFEHILEEVKEAKGVKEDTELDVEDLKEIVRRYKELYKIEKRIKRLRQSLKAGAIPAQLLIERLIELTKTKFLARRLMFKQWFLAIWARIVEQG